MWIIILSVSACEVGIGTCGFGRVALQDASDLGHSVQDCRMRLQLGQHTLLVPAVLPAALASGVTNA